MNIEIPILVTEQKEKETPHLTIFVRPLFGLYMNEQAETLPRALNKLAGKLRVHLETAGREKRHDDIATLIFAPSVRAEKLPLRGNFGGETEGEYLLATFSAFERRIAYTPNIPDAWFEYRGDESLEQRAVEVINEHFRELVRRGYEKSAPHDFVFKGKTYLTNLSLDINLPSTHEEKEQNPLAFLGGEEIAAGGEELRRVGRCLNYLFPHDLERTVGREAQTAELFDLLSAEDKRPVLIVGERRVGKTALVHEYVFQKMLERKNARSGEKLTWLLSPQRLISGMSYVGQWEERLLAILKETKEKKHLLYFDDLLGLFLAGISRDSDLNVGQVLKPFLEKREVRVVAEITPEALRVLREKDRAFADLFHIIRLSETGEDETWKILLATRRNLEHQFKCEFALDALPTALDLQRRYVREAFFPGKVVAFLRQLAVKFRDAKISREDVLREFEATSGLSVVFLDDREKLELDEIISALKRGIIGQNAAVEAAADAVALAKARLNDPTRPLAVFLFLGATGTGKTETAKQIAKYLYGAEEKLVRFDMNEYLSAYDVQRLIGTFDAPEGLLTSAIRRQPFCVLLFDEIEKAHGDVFNLLLQVLGEGRLTDALGRTADFSNAIIVLTSNLGAKEANSKLGFRQTHETEGNIFRQTAEKFFKPEFFNRLDRVIAFERLTESEAEQIAVLQMQKIFARQGFTRRRARLDIAPEALRELVRIGFRTEMGARSLKRALEKNLIQPIAQEFAATSLNTPSTVRVRFSEGKFSAQIEPLAALDAQTNARRVLESNEKELNKIDETLSRIGAEIEKRRPSGAVSPEDSESRNYFIAVEHLRRVEKMLERADRWHERETSGKGHSSTTPRRSRSLRQLVSADEIVSSAEFLASKNLVRRLRKMSAENRSYGELLEDYVRDIWRETALLRVVADSLETQGNSRRLLIWQTNDAETAETLKILKNLFAEMFARELGLQIIEPPTLSKKSRSSVTENVFSEFLIIEGIYADAAASAEVGTNLLLNAQGNLQTIYVRTSEITNATDGEEIVKILHQPTLESISAPLRLFDPRLTALDFRTALLTENALTVRELRTFWLGGLDVENHAEKN